MQAEILIVPTPASIEMLKRSAQKLAKTLVQNGVEVNSEISMCPDRRRLQHAVSKALNRSQLVFTLGGMGRDSGFLAKQVMSEGLSLPLEHSPEVLIAIREFAARTGIPSSIDDATLASLPTGSTPLIPAHGVVPGCMISSASQHVVMLPENEDEIIPMVTRQVMPILTKAGLSVSSSHELRTYGATEEQVRQLITDLMGTANPVVTTHTVGDQVVVKVTASGRSPAEATKMSIPVLKTIAGRLGDYAYGLDVASLQQAVVQKSEKKGITISVAEAGTYGRLAESLADVSGSSDVVKKVIKADDNNIKIDYLGIPKKMLRRRGDVSEYAAVAMANGIREDSASDLGAAICAHLPGEKQKEDSLVYIAVCNDRFVYVKKILVDEQSLVDNDAIIKAAVDRGLNMIRLFVDYLPEVYPGSVSLSSALAGKITVTDKEEYDENYTFDEPIAAELDTKKPKKRKPKKEKPPKTTKPGRARKIILLLAILIFLGGAGYLGLYAFQSMAARNLRDDLSKLYETAGFGGLSKINPDVVAFVEIEDTDLKYPIVQSKDNDFYLRRDFNKKSNQHGIPFMDYKSDPKKPSDNLIIYGHNMKDGQIFGELLNYKDIEYYKQHPTIKFDTIKKDGEYKIFSVFITSADPKHFDSGKVFEYHKFIDAANDAEFNAFIKQVRVRSLINMPVDVNPGDEIITLSTCDYDLYNSRYVVMARRIRTGESAEVDTNSAEKNPTPLYPDTWYKTYGGTKPDVENWDYVPPAGTAVPEPKEPDSDKTDDADIQQETEDENETSEDKSAADKAAADKAAADKAAADKAAADKAAADKAAADKAAADKAAADKAAADKAAADKAAADKAAADKAAAEKAKQDAEDIAIASVEVALKAVEDANSYQRSALNANTKKEASGYADQAKAAAEKAETAADSAKKAAETAGTQRAKDAAEQTSIYAKEARVAANSAVSTANDKPEEWDYSDTSADVNSSGGTLKIRSSSNYNPENNLEIISRIVQQEVGSSFHPEAIKAQAVATYTFIKEENSKGSAPSVSMAAKADAKVTNAVKAVLGKAVYYNGKYAFTPYHATSAGSTTDSSAVWGGGYPYLVSVDSSVDESARGFEQTKTMSADEVENRIYSKLGIEVSGDPSGWFEVLSTESGGYNGKMAICGATKSKKTGSVITGRLIRETVLNLRSAAFDVSYNSSSDTFSFTTYGYGHGVGMSQTGANAYANKGWNYVDILEHYYSGATVN